MTKLSDSQRSILKAASKQPKTDVREFMSHIKSTHIRDKVVTSMLNQGLVIEDPDAEGIAYIISEAGFAAIGKKPPEQREEEDDAAPVAETETLVTKREPKAKREGASKKQIMIDILSREEGATIAQLMEATGWLKHSVHGGMANLKKELQEKRGQTIVGVKDDGGDRIYKVISNDPAENPHPANLAAE